MNFPEIFSAHFIISAINFRYADAMILTWVTNVTEKSTLG